MISGQYTFSVDELIKASDYAARELARRGFRVMFTALGVCMLLSAVFLFGEGDAWLRVYVGIFGAYLAFFRRPLARVFVRHQFAKRPDKNISIRFEATEEGMSWSSPDSSSSFRWNLLAKVRRYEDGFLIFPNNRIFHWIPDHSLASADEVRALAEIFERNVKDYRAGN